MISYTCSSETRDATYYLWWNLHLGFKAACIAFILWCSDINIYIFCGQNAVAAPEHEATSPALQEVGIEGHCTAAEYAGERETTEVPLPHEARMIAEPSQLSEEEDSGVGHEQVPSRQRSDQLDATWPHCTELQRNDDDTTAVSDTSGVQAGAELIVHAADNDTSGVQPGAESIVHAADNDTSGVPTHTDGPVTPGLIPQEQYIERSGLDSVEPLSDVVQRGSATEPIVEGIVPQNYPVMDQEADIIAVEYLSPADPSTLSFQATDITVQPPQGKASPLSPSPS